jgi:hypothetical protein
MFWNKEGCGPIFKSILGALGWGASILVILIDVIGLLTNWLVLPMNPVDWAGCWLPAGLIAGVV